MKSCVWKPLRDQQWLKKSFFIQRFFRNMPLKKINVDHQFWRFDLYFKFWALTFLKLMMCKKSKKKTISISIHVKSYNLCHFKGLMPKTGVFCQTVWIQYLIWVTQIEYSKNENLALNYVHCPLALRLFLAEQLHSSLQRLLQRGARAAAARSLPAQPLPYQRRSCPLQLSVKRVQLPCSPAAPYQLPPGDLEDMKSSNW